MTDRDDERHMRRALELAASARGLTSPNPMVGAVIVNAGDVVGEGLHSAAGRPHAEVEALAVAGPRARGSTMYVTLEPCAHHGRTPPCAPAVVAAGIRRVVAASADPNPAVSGRGFDLLRAAGVDVAVGPLATEAAALNRVFFTAMRQRRPHVTLKGAMTLDGKIADVHGGSRWITGEPARREAHRLRSEADAIVVGVGTVLADDPALTVRLERPWPREPYRIVLDTHARTSPTARLIHEGAAARALIAIGGDAPLERVRALEAAGATVVRCATRGGRVDIAGLLTELFARDVHGLLVEGGGEVHAAFLDAGLVDRVAVFVAPRLLGGRTAPALVGGGGTDLKNAVVLSAFTVRAVGDDLLIESDVARPPAP
ncbi:MAG: bifunctional diaminohydroxyphosphoribosylaminopyrimidine deaminase/5-amino-6-(5-phosphoribosylamino)uracil reductase RibD [Candidatus Rokubacteria bacterium]|nr:bifunctional diaminohydroxyphosphoribosylaminopyrimidine deaminase/5-amino-6-(5-phosphoribosylamino)uracil reductase RibD [Candidatus Rokubacteria bacterium]